MKIIHNRYIPFKGFDAVNLFGVLFARKGFSADPFILNHEKIHTAQMKELLYIGFYMVYVFEFFFRMLQCLFQDNSKHKGISLWNRAYRLISFEKESYGHEKDLEYLRKRKQYAMWRE